MPGILRSCLFEFLMFFQSVAPSKLSKLQNLTLQGKEVEIEGLRNHLARLFPILQQLDRLTFDASRYTKFLHPKRL